MISFLDSRAIVKNGEYMKSKATILFTLMVINLMIKTHLLIAIFTGNNLRLISLEQYRLIKPSPEVKVDTRRRKSLELGEGIIHREE